MVDLAAPYPGYLQGIAEEVLRKLGATAPISSPHKGASAEVVAALTAGVEGRADDLVAFSHDLHAHPEVAYEEHDSVRRLARLLAAHGHDAEVGAYGLETALRSEAAGGPGPRVAVLAEYDALPEIGHACGHNVIATTAAGAFLAVADVIGDLGGSVVLLGTPAEEGGGGKELMAQAGAFEGVDACVMLHPAGFEVAEHPWIGVRTVDVVYRGVTAHAAAMPFLGRNALDAVVTAYMGFAQLRQHMLPSDRVHGVILEGGTKPNIVPERTSAQFLLRSAEPETLRILSDRAREILEAAALSTGTRAEITWDPYPVYLPVRNNSPLAARYAVAMTDRGRNVLPAGVMPGYLTGSTDLGNVSVRVPSIHPTVQVAPPGVSIHNPEFATYAIGAEADRACVDGAIGLARAVVDFLVDEDLRADAARAFAEAGGALDMDALLN